MLTDNDIKKFQLLYKEEFGVDISKEEAAEQGLKLVTLMSHAYKPMTVREHKGTEVHRQGRKEGLIDKLNEEHNFNVK